MQLLLPGQDHAFPPAADGGGEQGSNSNTNNAAGTGGRWYDFSSTHTDSYGEPLPHLPEFEDLADRPDVCPPLRRFSGYDGYMLEGERNDRES